MGDNSYGGAAGGSYGGGPAGGSYSGPSVGGSYSAPPAGGSYGGPSVGGSYSAPPAGGSYGGPSVGGSYSAPPAVGEAADGRVWLELGGDGRIAELYLDPRVVHLPLGELRDALVTAFTMAQDAVRDRAEAATARYAETVVPDRLKAALAEASDTAERRFAEVSVALYDLSRRADRPW
ncbi:Nucleoporin [Actinoplanes sp. SE50]|uniref:YbaB/EbfC family nucleoid-associated protein n=1 Tax=unclassified Actinoplanes TaxID=2626549 RepID=UPI00023EC08C|nr:MULTISPECIES: YbaB/EbfC family nucleoid-associated protein [unclassified Actinoplanes]AEV82990.1 Nucleoporin [Actinoplanes sp. SE50/110]ATO81386.1 Nucleoporin [Actinoplanes sp. SE50]SLL98793.1 hypothetical protein ACSP50_2020 [Actinoplanes sp. SE50/110]